MGEVKKNSSLVENPKKKNLSGGRRKGIFFMKLYICEYLGQKLKRGC